MRRDVTELSGRGQSRAGLDGIGRNRTEREGKGTAPDKNGIGRDGTERGKKGQDRKTELERRGRHRARTGQIRTGREGTEQDRRRRE